MDFYLNIRIFQTSEEVTKDSEIYKTKQKVFYKLGCVGPHSGFPMKNILTHRDGYISTCIILIFLNNRVPILI